MKTLGTLIRIASVVLLAWIIATNPVNTESRQAVDIGVAGRANANAAIASSGSFVAVAWAARTNDGVTDIYSAISRDGAARSGRPRSPETLASPGTSFTR